MKTCVQLNNLCNKGMMSRRLDCYLDITANSPYLGLVVLGETQVLFLYIKTKFALLAGIGWSISFSKSQRISYISFSRTDSGLWIYYVSIIIIIIGTVIVYVCLFLSFFLSFSYFEFFFIYFNFYLSHYLYFSFFLFHTFFLILF